jgi:DNA segregation ATPase FtsK/SpoIIIE-like protein
VSPKKASKSRGALRRSVRWEGLLWLCLGLYAALSLAGGGPGWREAVAAQPGLEVFRADHPGGPVGSALAFVVRAAVGVLWCWALPVWLVWRGLGLLLRREAPWFPGAYRLAPLWLTSSAWLGQPDGPLAERGAALWGGGVGVLLANGFHALVGTWGGRIFLSFLLITAVLHAARPWLAPLMERLGPVGRVLGDALTTAGRWLLLAVGLPWRLVKAIAGIWSGTGRDMARLRRRPATDAVPVRRHGGSPEAAAAATAAPEPERTPKPVAPPEPRKVHLRSSAAVPIETPGDDAPLATVTRRTAVGGSMSVAVRGGDGETFSEAETALVDTGVPIPLPDLGLLNDPPPDSVVIGEQALHASADLLEETLRSFGVEGSVKDVRPGPVVTTFEYQPGTGVKINAITQRSDDLALAMRARSIRMEAPIPGKAAVGIEIPNPEQQIVTMKEVFTKAAGIMDKPLSVVLGRDVFGDAVAIDLAEQPHLLVAGSTGSGKSVCINAMISSLLLRCDPSIVRLLLIDPKMLELNVYNDIPHLLLPVVTDPKEALRALKWMEAQMDHRYRRLAKHSVRNIEAYNRKVESGLIRDSEDAIVRDPMPYYVTIVDELADLMVQLGPDIELPITRIAQKARAVGIHLILATQRPSVDVLTGVIKANVPCRIAFRVIQKNDSRTILDANGAEKLLGKGDMLYLQPGRAQPRRVHGAYIDIEECERIADHWRDYKDTTLHITLDEAREESGHFDLESDELFERAREIVVASQHGSTSMLQRKLQVGYARAGRLMDLLENAGVVGPFQGSKAREVLMKAADLQALEAFEGDDPL